MAPDAEEFLDEAGTSGWEEVVKGKPEGVFAESILGAIAPKGDGEEVEMSLAPSLTAMSSPNISEI